MFDISFTELMVIGAVALVVLGPERLPKVARTVGHLVGRLQRYVGDVKRDINREMELDELRRLRTEMDDAAREVESSVRQHTASLQSEVDGISKSVRGRPTGGAEPKSPAVEVDTAPPAADTPAAAPAATVEASEEAAATSAAAAADVGLSDPARRASSMSARAGASHDTASAASADGAAGQAPTGAQTASASASPPAGTRP